MVLPLFKVGRLALKNIPKKDYRLAKANEFNDRITTNTMQRRNYGTDVETRTSIKNKGYMALGVLIISAAVALGTVGVRTYVEMRTRNTASLKLVTQEIEALEEEIIQKRRLIDAKKGGGFEAKNSRD